MLNSLVFGVVYKENDPTWKWLQDLQELGTKHIGVAGPVNFMPFLRSVYLLTFASVFHEDRECPRFPLAEFFYLDFDFFYFVHMWRKVHLKIYKTVMLFVLYECLNAVGHMK